MAIGALLLIGVIAAGTQSKALYGMFKGWRARTLAQKVETLIDSREWQAAAEKAQAAYQLSPTEPAAIRAVARLQSSAGRGSAAVPFWKQLAETGKMTADDRRSYAEDLLAAGDQDGAAAELAVLQGSEPENAATLRLEAKVRAVENRVSESIAAARRAVELDPGSSEGRLLFETLRVRSSSDATERAAGAAELLKLAENHDRSGVRALEVLSRVRELTPEQLARVIELLKTHPHSTPLHRLAALDLEIAQHPAERGALLDAVTAEMAGAEAAGKRAFCVWLNAHGEFDRTLKFLPLDQAMERKDFLLVHLDALAAKGRWREIQQILDAKNVPLDEAYVELFRARAATELGEPSKADLYWRRARVAAAPSAEQTMYLAEYAERIGQIDQAELAYRSLTTNASAARRGYEALLRMAQRRNDSGAMRSLLKEMLERWPADDSVKNDVAYLSLLAFIDVPSSTETARQLVLRNPASLPHRTTLALGYLRMNQPAEALAVYDGIQLPWEQMRPNQRAIYAATLGANGRVEEAQAAAAGLPREAFTAEELDLAGPWLGSGSSKPAFRTNF
jgi:hypothetical protein